MYILEYAIKTPRQGMKKMIAKNLGRQDGSIDQANGLSRAISCRGYALSSLRIPINYTHFIYTANTRMTPCLNPVKPHACLAVGATV